MQLQNHGSRAQSLRALSHLFIVVRSYCGTCIIRHERSRAYTPIDTFDREVQVPNTLDNGSVGKCRENIMV